MPIPADSENVEKSQVDTDEKHAFSGRHRFALYLALISAVGALLTGIIPPIVELFSTKPTVQQVQDMIASQATALTTTLNKVIDMVNGLDTRLDEVQQNLAKFNGELEVLKSCCSSKKSETIAFIGPPVPPTEPPSIEKALKPTLKKVPEMRLDVQAK